MLRCKSEYLHLITAQSARASISQIKSCQGLPTLTAFLLRECYYPIPKSVHQAVQAVQVKKNYVLLLVLVRRYEPRAFSAHDVHRFALYAGTM